MSECQYEGKCACMYVWPWATPLLRPFFSFMQPFPLCVHVNEPLTKGHPSYETSFAWLTGWSWTQGPTVLHLIQIPSGKREFWMITQVVSSAMLCTGSCTEKCWAKQETRQLADGVQMYGGLLCSDSWQGARLQKWKSSWALSLARSTSLLQVVNTALFFLLFFLLGGWGGVNADNSFSVAFDFPFHWGSECRQFIFCFNFPFQGGGVCECRQFIFCCFWFSFSLGEWMQTVHFLL